MLNLGEPGSFRIGNVYCKYRLFDTSRPVVITFSHHVSGVDENLIQQGPNPWGFEFLAGRNVNAVSFSFISGKYAYYRDHDLFGLLPEIADDLQAFPDRLGYGCSAGAYAVSAFSNILKLDRILLLCPISTRDRSVNTWDYDAGRFRASYDFDWSGPYADGAASHAEGYVIYDPLYRLDRLHAERYLKLKKLKLPGTGHLVPERLLRLGMLAWTVDQFLSGSIPENEFHARGRKRKDLRDYYVWMSSKENPRLSGARAKALADALARKQPDLYYDIKLAALSQALKPGHEPADILRDLAVTFDTGGDKRTAFALMEQAHRLRPGGPFIRARYESLKAQIATDDLATDASEPGVTMLNRISKVLRLPRRGAATARGAAIRGRASTRVTS